MKKKKVLKQFVKMAKSFLDDVPDDQISTVPGLQDTMNQFLQSAGLPPVSIPGVSGVSDVAPETRSYEEIENELYGVSDV